MTSNPSHARSAVTIASLSSASFTSFLSSAHFSSKPSVQHATQHKAGPFSAADIMEETEEEVTMREAVAKYLESDTLINNGNNDTIRASFGAWAKKFEKDGSEILVTVLQAIKNGFFPTGKPKEGDQALSGGWSLWWKVVNEYSKKPIRKKKREVCLF